MIEELTSEELVEVHGGGVWIPLIVGGIIVVGLIGAGYYAEHNRDNQDQN